MAYTEALDVATPTDSDLLSTGDDSIRQLKRALIERFGTLVVDVTINPWAIKPERLTNTRKFRISGVQFNPADQSTVPAAYAVLSAGPNTHSHLIMYGCIPGHQMLGAVLKNARIRASSLSAPATVTATLYHIDDSGVPTSLATFAVITNSGAQTITQPITLTVQAGDLFVFEVVMDTVTAGAANDTELYWAEIETT